MTLSGALSEDDIPFSLGVLTLLPSQDPKGRSFLYYDPSKFDSYHRWYNYKHKHKHKHKRYFAISLSLIVEGTRNERKQAR